MTYIPDGENFIRVLAQPSFKTRSANPYNWLLYTSMKKLGIQIDEYAFAKVLTQHYDVWHLHWPELPLNEKNTIKVGVKLMLLLAQLSLARRKGTKIVWTVHNLAAHERRHPKLEQWFWAALVGQLDGYISLSQAGIKAAQEKLQRLSRLPGFVIPHGHYREEYSRHVSSQKARSKLGISETAKVILFFGRIRSYKNVTALLQAFNHYTAPDVVLCIAGQIELSDLEREIKAEASLDPRVRLFLNFIPKEDVQLYFHACDLVVLPYQEILNSGSAVLALSFDRPVLVPQRGALGELQTQVGELWVQTYTDQLSPKHLDDALHWASTVSRTQPSLEMLDWPALAQQTLDAYQCLVSPQSSIKREALELG
jgi:beta-1,4-mannosyltransferase